MGVGPFTQNPKGSGPYTDLMHIPLAYGQANLIFNGAAQPNLAVNCWGFHNTGPLSATQCADAFIAAWEATGLTLQASNASLIGCNVKLGPNATGPTAEVSGGDIGGTGGGAASPQVALLVKKVTAFGGRSGRGRAYIPGIPVGEVNSNGLIDAGYLAAWESELVGFGAALALAGLDLVLLHTEESPAPTSILELLPQALCATQRRRVRP